jgi:hypothetical protein
MPHVSQHGERSVMLLEVLAASVIFSIAAIVLYMVFSYRP